MVMPIKVISDVNNNNIFINNKNIPITVTINTIMARKNIVLNTPSSTFIYACLEIFSQLLV